MSDKKSIKPDLWACFWFLLAGFLLAIGSALGAYIWPKVVHHEAKYFYFICDTENECREFETPTEGE